MTQQEKVVARFGATLEQTALLQGHFARTLDRPTNQLRLLASQITQSAQEFGSALLPAVSAVFRVVAAGTSQIAELVKEFNNLDPFVKSLAISFGLFAVALGPALKLFGLLASAIGGAVAVFAAINAPVLAIGAGLVAVVAAGAAVASTWEELNRVTETIWGKIVGTVLRSARAIVDALKSVSEFVGLDFEVLNESSEKLSRSIRENLRDEARSLGADFGAIFDNFEPNTQRLIASISGGFDTLKSAISDFFFGQIEPAEIASDEILALYQGLTDSLKQAFNEAREARKALAGGQSVEETFRNQVAANNVLISALKQSREEFDIVSEQQQILQSGFSGTQSEVRALAETFVKQRNDLSALQNQYEKADEGLRHLKDLFRSIRGPDFQETLNDLEQLRRGVVINGEFIRITAEEFSDAWEDASIRALEASRDWADGLELAVRRVRRDLELTADDLANAIERGLDRAGDALADFVLTGKASLEDLGRSILEDFVRLASRNLVRQAFTSIFGGLFPQGEDPAQRPDIQAAQNAADALQSLTRAANQAALALGQASLGGAANDNSNVRSIFESAGAGGPFGEAFAPPIPRSNPVLPGDLQTGPGSLLTVLQPLATLLTTGIALSRGGGGGTLSTIFTALSVLQSLGGLFGSNGQGGVIIDGPDRPQESGGLFGGLFDGLINGLSRIFEIFGGSLSSSTNAIDQQRNAFANLTGQSFNLSSVFGQLAAGQSSGGGGLLGSILGIASSAFGAFSGVGANPFPIPTTGPNGLPASFASGGFVQGPGTSTSDSIRAFLSNGEFVVNAAATAANRPILEAINAGRNATQVPLFIPQQVPQAANEGMSDERIVEEIRGLRRSVRQRRTGTRPTEKGFGYTPQQLARQQSAIAQRQRARS